MELQFGQLLLIVAANVVTGGLVGMLSAVLGVAVLKRDMNWVREALNRLSKAVDRAHERIDSIRNA